MDSHVEVTPAYGRTYTTVKAARQAWTEGLDFRTTTGPYINKQDAENYNVGVVLRMNGNVYGLRKRSRS